MDCSQLYDAFEDILEIKISRDKFQVLFKKVSTFSLATSIAVQSFTQSSISDRRETSRQGNVGRIPLLLADSISGCRHQSEVADGGRAADGSAEIVENASSHSRLQNCILPGGFAGTRPTI